MSYPINFTWTGVDGTVWPFKRLTEQSLTNPLRIKPPGIKGLAGAPGEHDDDQNVDQAGVTWRAKMLKPNVITIPVLFGPVVPGQAALDKWWDFRDSFGDGRQLGKFNVQSRRKNVLRDRFQAARLLGEFPDVDDMRVSSHGFVEVGEVQIRSDESWWRQAPIDISYTPTQFAGASVPNVSDDDAWAYWEILGPITNPTIGLNGESITLVITVPAGQTWRINTDPNNFLVRDGANVDRSFLRNYWRKRAPRKTAASLNNGTTDIPVALGGTGTNSNTRIRLVLPQVYRAAM
ncbi:hypothetical protein [Rhodococcoides fascians]|uniref:hypothetical protein n=1 Tax=Rhodococcoides fascians TaxID=1828 RepID=UPI00056C5D16|nr:hypothetical protein [Rhodococcus fascians]